MPISTNFIKERYKHEVPQEVGTSFSSYLLLFSIHIKSLNHQLVPNDWLRDAHLHLVSDFELIHMDNWIHSLTIKFTILKSSSFERLPAIYFMSQLWYILRLQTNLPPIVHMTDEQLKGSS